MMLAVRRVAEAVGRG